MPTATTPSLPSAGDYPEIEASHFEKLRPSRIVTASDVRGGQIAGVEEGTPLVQLIRRGDAAGKAAHWVRSGLCRLLGKYPRVLDGDDLDADMVESIRGGRQYWEDTRLKTSLLGREGSLPYYLLEYIRLHHEVAMLKKPSRKDKEYFYGTKSYFFGNAAPRGGKEEDGKNGSSFYRGRFENLLAVGPKEMFRYVKDAVRDFGVARSIYDVVHDGCPYRSSFGLEFATSPEIFCPSHSSVVNDPESDVLLGTWDHFGSAKVVALHPDDFDDAINEHSISVTKGPYKGHKIIGFELGGVRVDAFNVLQRNLASGVVGQNIIQRDITRRGPGLEEGRHTLSWLWHERVTTYEQVMHSICTKTHGVPEGSPITIR